MIEPTNENLILLFFIIGAFLFLGFMLGYTVKSLFQNEEHISGLKVIDEWLDEAIKFRKETKENLEASKILLEEIKERGA